MHNLAHRHFGISACYGRYRLMDGGHIRDAFFELELAGANITVPHKESAYRLADEVRGLAQEIQSVNTYCLESDRIVAYNTDAPGFLRSIEEFEGVKKAWVLGAGGTAKAIAYALRSQDVDVTILNRSKGRLEFFNEQGFATCSWDDAVIQPVDLIVNTTSAGLSDNNLPAPEEILLPLLEHSRYAFDVVYGHVTPFLEQAQQNSCRCKDGLEMLLFQGAYAFLHFHGERFDFSTLSSVMRRGLEL